MTTAHADYVPAAGKHWLLPLYDPFLALFTREKRWRGLILDSLELKAGDVVADVGCGTGTLAVMAKQRAPGAEIVGVDPDPNALKVAARKAQRKGASLVLHQGFGRDVARLVGDGRADKAVSSMVFHHMQADAQAETLASIHQALKPGGALRIADFATGHHLPGPTGSLERDIAAAGFENVRTLAQFRVAFNDAIIVAAEKPRGA